MLSQIQEALHDVKLLVIERLSAICHKGAPISTAVTAVVSLPLAVSDANAAPLFGINMDAALIGVLVSILSTIVLTLGTLYFRWRAVRVSERLADQLAEQVAKALATENGQQAVIKALSDQCVDATMKAFDGK